MKFRPDSTEYKSVIMVVLPGFEPGSLAPKANMIDHYTTGL